MQPELAAIRHAVLDIQHAYKVRDQAIIDARKAGYSWPQIVAATTLTADDNTAPGKNRRGGPGEIRSVAGAMEVVNRANQ